MANTDVVRRMIDAYLAQDVDTAARLLADDLRFTSPQDDQLDKAAFMERCFPTADRLVSQEILELVQARPQAIRRRLRRADRPGPGPGRWDRESARRRRPGSRPPRRP